jgi:hypothetical protein
LLKKKEHYDKIVKNKLEIEKVKSKFDIETIELNQVMNLFPSFQKQYFAKSQHCLEVCFYDDTI